MSKVFEDKNCVEFLLQIILKRDDLKVTSVSSQYVIKNLQGRSVRLDILAVDRQNQVYNIEIQRDDKGAGVKRARYNSSILDANLTQPGDQYENLNETYVIFITENDALKRKLPIYHIDRAPGRGVRHSDPLPLPQGPAAHLHHPLLHPRQCDLRRGADVLLRRHHQYDLPVGSGGGSGYAGG